MNLHIRRSFAGIFVFLYILSYVNSAAFSHTHYLPDGKAMTHSHPFKSASHSHSSTDFHFIPSGGFVAAVNVIPSLAEVCMPAVEIIDGYSAVLPDYFMSACSLRGPPSFI